MKERTKHQRYANKKNEEMRALLQEVLLLLYKSRSQHSFTVLLAQLQVEELRSSERTLRTRVKSLTNELGVLKRR